jgi:hypothetical protein
MMPHFISQSKLNYLIRDLNLAKSQDGQLGSRLQGWDLLEKGTKATLFLKHQKGTSSFVI